MLATIKNTITSKNNKVVDNNLNTNEAVDNNSDFDMQQLINIIGQSAMTTQAITQQMGLIVAKTETLENNINEVQSVLSSKIEKLVNDENAHYKELKENSEITTTKQEKIIETAQHRVSEILGFDDKEKAKYFRTFILRIYSDARKYAGLGSKISRTKEGNYQRVIDFMDAWTPNEGINNLKRKADERAKYRREAKNLGY